MTSAVSAQPISGTMGAEIRGFDVESADAHQISTLKDALHEHKMVVLRDQDLVNEAHVRFAGHLGELAVHPVVEVFGGTEPLEMLVADPETPQAADHWHTDVSFAARPPAYGTLFALEMPSYGGDTLWCDQQAAYDALSPALAERLHGLTVHHVLGDNYYEEITKRLDADHAELARDALGAGSHHPLVRTHPATGRSGLFVSDRFMAGIDGMTRSESGTLLDFLVGHATQAQFQVRWRWRVGDLVLWDERSTLHFGMADFTGRRVLRRVAVQDTCDPYFEPAI